MKNNDKDNDLDKEQEQFFNEVLSLVPSFRHQEHAEAEPEEEHLITCFSHNFSQLPTIKAIDTLISSIENEKIGSREMMHQIRVELVSRRQRWLFWFSQFILAKMLVSTAPSKTNHVIQSRKQLEKKLGVFLKRIRGEDNVHGQAN